MSFASLSPNPPGCAMHPRHRARQALVQALYQWHYNPSAPRELDRQLLEAGYLEGVEHAFFQELLRKTIDRQEEIDNLLLPAIQPRRITQLTGVELAILRVAIGELLERPDTPYRVVIDEAVELAKAFGTEQGYRFVNAVLDRLTRERPEWGPEPSADGDG